MDENGCIHYHHLLSKVDRSKDDFLDWFEHVYEIDGKDEAVYEVVVGWSEEKTIEFAKWFDWELDRIRLRIYSWDKRYRDDVECVGYIECEHKENDLAFAGQDRSRELIK